MVGRGGWSAASGVGRVVVSRLGLLGFVFLFFLTLNFGGGNLRSHEENFDEGNFSNYARF